MIQVQIGFHLDVCFINYLKGILVFIELIRFLINSFRHSPFRQHKTKDKHEIDKMTMTMVNPKKNYLEKKTIVFYFLFKISRLNYLKQ